MNAFVAKLLRDLSWCNPDRAMAELCGVSRPTIYRYRMELGIRKYHRYMSRELRVVRSAYPFATDRDNAEVLGLTESKAQYLRRDLAGLRVEAPHEKRVYA